MKKVQMRRIGSGPRAFQRAIDGVHMLPLRLPKGNLKSDFLFFNQVQFQSNKVWTIYKAIVQGTISLHRILMLVC